jgi:hypothetical protein
MSRRRVVFGLSLVIWISLLMITGCRSQNNISASSLDSLVIKNVGPSAIGEYNLSRTYILYKESGDSASYGGPPLKYAVFRIKDNEIVLNGKFSRGYVKWTGDLIIEVVNIPEKVNLDQDLAVYKRQIYIEGR